MKFGKTFTNKLVSFADQHFTWDYRSMKREDENQHFDFIALRKEDGRRIAVGFHRSQYGIWAFIEKDGTDIHRGYLKTYSDVNAFKKMVKCLG